MFFNRLLAFAGIKLSLSFTKVRYLLRFFIELSYNGKAYHGWQNQPNAITVQEVLEHALSTLLQKKIGIVGAGRTDTGVHASQMFAHFDIDQDFEVEQLVYKLNSYLPKDIAVHSIFRVNQEAHARFNALSRTYHYKISTEKSVFDYDYAYLVRTPLDLEAMNKACEILYEYKDFQCFSKSNTDVKTYHCNITHAHWRREQDQLFFSITANRFLRNMVRAIVGTMVNIGKGKLQYNDLHDIIRSKDRKKAGFSVPARGLYLVNVGYPDKISLN